VEKLIPTTNRAFALGVAVALSVLALTLFAGWLFVRALVRQQIAQRDAEALHATTLMEQLDAQSDSDLRDLLPEDQVGFDAALRASRLRGVMGIRFFDPQGRFTDAFPGTIQPSSLPSEDLAAARQLKPHSRFVPQAPLDSIFIYLPQFATGNIPRVPTLEVTVPLHHRDGTNLAGAAQFIVEGQSIAMEYARLDRYLASLALVAFGVGSVLLVAMLWPAFRKLGRLNRELAQRNERLLRANRELALAARTAALGAVSGHLMHGLKNPLASLSQFVSALKSGESPDKLPEVADALTAAHRMQSLVEQTLEVLADTQGAPSYDIGPAELAQSVRERVQPLAQRKQVQLQVAAPHQPVIPSRTANLGGLILVNLLENAIEVTPSGKTVSLTGAANASGLVFRVEDNGPGFPDHLRPNLFLPCHSTREGGSGIGLAISRQLADYLGARLELKRSSPDGCVFELELPLQAEPPGAGASPA
jgi:signal transduction histidine kinase